MPYAASRLVETGCDYVRKRTDAAPRRVEHFRSLTDNAYTRTFRRAIETLGGAERLASTLGATVAEIEAWTIGTAVPPPAAFLAAIDIVARAGVFPKRAAQS